MPSLRARARVWLVVGCMGMGRGRGTFVRNWVASLVVVISGDGDRDGVGMGVFGRYNEKCGREICGGENTGSGG